MKLSEKQRTIKNFLAINIVFVLIFSAVNCTNSIQPIINRVESLGTISQSVVYASQILTSLVLPQVILELFGFKVALILGEILHLAYVLVQIDPNWWLFMPASVLAGMGNSLCWTIYGIYLTLCSKLYSKQKNTEFRKIQTLFFGISTSIFLSSNVLAQSLVAIILKTTEDNSTNILNSELTTPAANNFSILLNSVKSKPADEVDFDFANSCGANNCPDTKLPGSLSNITRTSFLILYFFLILLCVLSMLVTFFFMDNIKDEEEKSGETEVEEAEPIEQPVKEKLSFKVVGQRFKTELSSLLRLYTNIDVWLLFPLTIYTGFELTFIWFEFNNAFATCLLGVNYVGWANIIFGVLGSMLSLLMGYILKHIGTMSGIVFMIMIAVCQNIFILSWTPRPDQVVTVFLVIISFAFSQSVSNGQVRGLYGVYFPNNPSAFSAAALSQTTGLFLGSLISAYSCVYIKSYIYIGVVLSGLICYVILAVKHAKMNKAPVTDKQKLLANDADANMEQIHAEYVTRKESVLKF